MPCEINFARLLMRDIISMQTCHLSAYMYHKILAIYCVRTNYRISEATSTKATQLSLIPQIDNMLLP